MDNRTVFELRNSLNLMIESRFDSEDESLSDLDFVNEVSAYENKFSLLQ